MNDTDVISFAFVSCNWAIKRLLWPITFIMYMTPSGNRDMVFIILNKQHWKYLHKILTIYTKKMITLKL